MSDEQNPKPSFLASALGGGLAGLATDTVIFPIDTIKTRLQAPKGFAASGGFAGLFNGLKSAAMGSVPSATLFFATYDSSKNFLYRNAIPEHSSWAPLVHMVSASAGETVACLVRVPTENIKQNMQAGTYSSTKGAIKSIRIQGFSRFFAGFGTTVLRDVPFSFLQFPMYEHFKAQLARYEGLDNLQDLPPLHAAFCGSVAGALAGGCTTPLDVVKTRLMLGKDRAGVPYTTFSSTIKRIYAEQGITSLFAGLSPRMIWISLGGFVFFGSYEFCKMFLDKAVF